MEERPSGESGPRPNGFDAGSSLVSGGGSRGLIASPSNFESLSLNGGNVLWLPSARLEKVASTGLWLKPSLDELASRAIRIFSGERTFSSTGELVLVDLGRPDVLSGGDW